MKEAAFRMTPLFRGLSDEETAALLRQLHSTEETFEKGQILLHTGDVVTRLGLVLAGSVQMERVDLVGNKSILGISQQGDLFAEAYACIPDQPLVVDVAAREPCRVRFLSVSALFAAAEKGGCAQKVLANLLRITARKNRALSMRIIHASPKTIREKLYSYFSEQSALQNSRCITIPFDRQQMADYLGVERTALSKELGRMRREGLLDFRKNRFTLRF